MPRRKQGDEIYVNAAILCDRLLLEADGTISAVRIVDRVTLGIPPDIDELPPAFRVGVNLLVVLKSPSFLGETRLTVVAVEPKGDRTELLDTPIEMTPAAGATGKQIRISLQLGSPQEGLYWIEVRLDGRRRTRTPLTIEFVRRPPGPDDLGQIDYDTIRLDPKSSG